MRRLLCRLRPAPAGSLRCFAAAPTALPPRPLLLGAAPRAWAPRRPLGTASAAADADGAAAAQAEPADEGEAEADDAEGDGAAAQAEPGGEEAKPGGEGGAPAGGGAQPQPFADALRAAEQLRESGAPLDDSTIGPLLKKAIGGGGSMKPQSAERVKAALELLEAEKAQPSAKLLWQLLSRLRHKRPNPHAGDIACDLVDEFFAAGTGLNIDTYNLLLGVVLRHRVKKVSQVAKALVEFPGVYANEKTFAIVIEACTRQGEVDQALGYVTRMEQMRYSPRPVLVFKLLELCALENDAKSARVCLRVLVGQANRRGVTLDDGSVIMLANLAARTGSHKLLNEVKEHLCYSGSPAPVSNESAFLHASLQCAAKAVKLDLCFETIEALATAGVEVDSATMWQAARAIAIDEETVDDAYYAVEARHQNDETVSVDSLNLSQENGAVARRGCAQLRDVGRAIETFDSISNTFGLVPNIRSYDGVLQCCIRSGHDTGAMSFLDEMAQQGVKPDGATFSTVLLALAQTLETASNSQDVNDRSRVLSTQLELAAEEGHRPSYDALVTATRAFAKQRRFRQAWDVIRTLRPNGYRPTDELIAFVKNGGKDPEPDDEVAPSESGEAGEQGSQKRQAS